MTDAEKIAQQIFDLFHNDEKLWFVGDRLEVAIRSAAFKDGFGSPTPNEIKKYFRRLGYDTLEADANRRLGGQLRIYENAIIQLVDQRVKIAHGDPVVSSTERDIKTLEDQVRQYCKATDYSVCHYFRKIGCRFPRDATSY